MRILYVIQRYGDKIIGGSESACRAFAEELVKRDHEVEVLTSCAHRYTDWADEYEPGLEVINGVKVHRLSVVEPRTDELFGPIHYQLSMDPNSLPFFEQRRWARLMGPNLNGQRSWLVENSTRFDVVIFMTYLYATCTSGLPTVAGRVPTVLQPTAHDEPPAYVPIYQSLFRLPDSYLFFTPDEKEVVQDIYGFQPSGEVAGMGIEQNLPAGNASEFREQFDIGNCPYLLYVGRLDPSKGVGELLRFFHAFKKRHPTDLKLVLLGDGDLEIETSTEVIKTGFVDEQVKRDALVGALALVQPSYFESFSIVLCESWVQKRPALVQGKCRVLRGQALRSGGAIPYEGFAEFETAVEMLLDDEDLGDTLGSAGFDYVKRNYDWSTVMTKFEKALNEAQIKFNQRRLVTKPKQ
jgi:glycosyltransferase involved in cell wall biosynthesis